MLFNRNDLDLAHLFKFNANSYQAKRQKISIPSEYKNRLESYCDDLYHISDNWSIEQQYKGFYHNLCLFLLQLEIIQDKQNLASGLEKDKKLADYLAFSQLLEQHYKTEFKVDFYTDALNMSLKVLTKLTKTYFKLSPKAVIDQRRILEIKTSFKRNIKIQQNHCL